MGIINTAEDREVFYTVGGTPDDEFDIPFHFVVADEIGVDVDGVPEGGLTVVGAGLEGVATRTVTLSSPVSNVTVRVYDATEPVRRSSFASPGVFSASAVDREFDRVFQYLQAILATTVTSSNIISVLDTILGGDTWRNGYADLAAAVAAAEAAVTAAQAEVVLAQAAVTDAETAETNAQTAQAAAEAAQAAAEAALAAFREEIESVRTQSGSGTAVLTDDRAVVLLSNATAMNFTIPPQSSVTWPDYARIHVIWYGAGQPTIVAGAGVTIRTESTLLLYAQYSCATLMRIASDEWVIIGSLEAAP